MNLFEFFVNLTHMHNADAWAEADATFTGRTRKATKRGRHRIIVTDYDAYEITYFAGDEKVYSWHTFHPLPDPDPAALTGTRIRIRYKKRKPADFEIIPANDNSL